MKQKISEKLKLLDAVSGVYIMKNQELEVIYVGKAKNLINRVTQYFTKPHSGKTQKMVNDVDDFDFIITNSEKDALLLEINLIHEYLPKYNVLLKDDKSYPYIQIKGEKNPKIIISRKINDKKSIYFGPYPSSSTAYEIVDLLNQIFPLRKCQKIPKKPCLYYHLGQCLAPCINEVSSETYSKIIKDIRSFIGGNNKNVIKEINEKMKKAAKELKFELAGEYKKILENIEYVGNKANVVSTEKIDRDVFAFHSSDDYISISTLIFRQGNLINRINNVIPLYGNEIDEFFSYIIQFYEKNILPKEIIIPSLDDLDLLEDALKIKIYSPKKGNKMDILSMCAKNAIKALEEQNVLSSVEDSDLNKTLDYFKGILGINSLRLIELIDNSHLSGENAVSAVVVFQNGIPNKKMYRKYKLSNDSSGNDVASINEVIYRRYYRKLTEKNEFSNLILIDGGINQVNAAKKALKDLMIEIPVYGLVKDDKHTTRALIDQNGNEYDISKSKPLFFLLTRMQDEVHRFAINYHRNLRNRTMTKSILDDIKGLGSKRIENLLKNYGSISKIKNASIEELQQYVPEKVAINIYRKLENIKDE
ncbi:MAG: excinuclease ABC subunit UvrC [Bacilli bacterium]